ncbi:hypothetical protein acdb102_17150 [Acidothermaceae bacterium B102]|nr:hypothetical protein acdb102_17150 [Acidothermaceae bacterium B102]
MLRLSTVVVPLVVAIVAMVAVADVLPRPAHGPLMAGWYVLLLAISYGASWATGKVMDRSLPLAALLEMSLTFPESAPSRLGLAQRGGSAAALTRLATAPPDESTQAAAERILKLLTALSAHDRFTRGHAERVRAYTDLIAANMRLSDGDRDRLRWAALLHDIGKLRVPSSVLNKPGKPSALEWEQLKAHPTQGSLIAAPLLEWLRPMDRVIAEHHERFDGTGYPVGLSGDGISQGARIVTVADCFEAMTAVRAYNKPMKREAALAELVRCAGTQFDPVVVRALLAVPQRRLLWAMGPTAWLAGLPWVGQGSLGVVRATVGHVGTVALSVGAVAVAAVAPTALFTSAQADPPARLSAAHSPALPSAAASVRPTGSPAPTTHAPAPVPQLAVRKPTPHKTPHIKAPHHAAATTPPTTAPQPVVTSTHPVVTTTPAAPTTTTHTTTTSAPTTPAPTTRPTTVPAPTTTAAPTTTTEAPHTTTPAPHTTAPTTSPAAPTTTTAPTTSAAAPTTTTAAPTTTAVAAAAALSCTATYKSTNNNGLAATITVTNTGTAISTGWTVTWSWPDGNPQIKNASGASVHQSGKAVTATNGLLNGLLLPKLSTMFTISGNGNAVAQAPTLTCTEH